MMRDKDTLIYCIAISIIFFKLYKSFIRPHSSLAHLPHAHSFETQPHCRDLRERCLPNPLRDCSNWFLSLSNCHCSMQDTRVVDPNGRQPLTVAMFFLHTERVLQLPQLEPHDPSCRLDKVVGRVHSSCGHMHADGSIA